jgi:carbamoyltransferase
MIRWGMVGNSHDASLAVFENNRLYWAALSKDFSDVPNDPDPNWTMLEVARQSFGPPDEIIWYERPFLKTIRQFTAGQGWLWSENNIKNYLARWGISAPIRYTTHHLSHAAYAYYTQPNDNCAVICLDSIGEFETLTMWHGWNGELRKVYSQRYPHSLGLFYSAMTQRVGLEPQKDEYKICDMAAKGDPLRFYRHMHRDILDSKIGKVFTTKVNLHRGCRWWKPELRKEQDMYDLAATTQMVFEQAIQDASYKVFDSTNSHHLALAGGGALNKQGVDKIRKQWESIWVPPNPGDPGSCIGAVLARTKTKIVSVDKRWYQKV